MNLWTNRLLTVYFKQLNSWFCVDFAFSIENIHCTIFGCATNDIQHRSVVLDMLPAGQKLSAVMFWAARVVVQKNLKFMLFCPNFFVTIAVSNSIKISTPLSTSLGLRSFVFPIFCPWKFLCKNHWYYLLYQGFSTLWLLRIKTFFLKI